MSTNQSINRKQFCLITTTLLGASVLPGCGGGSGNSPSSLSGAGGRGVVNLTIRWPERSRLIPEASNSIKFVVTTTEIPGVTIVKEKVVPRPTGTNITQIALDGLPEVTLQITASAYPNADGTGNAQATGETQVILTEENNTANKSFTMDSTIDHIDVTPTNPEVLLNKTLTLIAEAKDRNNVVVMTKPAKMEWHSSDATVASVDILTGVVTGKKADKSALITITDTESGKSADVTVTVKNKVLTVSPQNLEVLSLGADDPEKRFETLTVTGGTAPYQWGIDNQNAGAFRLNQTFKTANTIEWQPNRHMADATITVKDADGTIGSTKVTVTTSDLIVSGTVSLSISEGTLTQVKASSWRVSAPVGKHVLTVTTNKPSQYYGINSYSLSGYKSFIIGGAFFGTSGYVSAGHPVEISIERVP